MDSKSFLKIAAVIFVGVILLFIAYNLRGYFIEDGLSNWLPKLSLVPNVRFGTSGSGILSAGSGSSGGGVINNTGGNKDELARLIASRRDPWPEGFDADKVSEAYQKVTITASPSRQPYSEDYPSRITLRTGSLKNGEKIDVTGFKLLSADDQIEIGQAVVKYPPYATLGSALQNIVLNQGEYVEIYSTESAISYNVRNNKCFGYLESKIDFKPRINTSCPSIDYSIFYKTTGTCQDDVRRLGHCQDPEPNQYNALSNECRAILGDKLSYAGCYREHQKDGDFLGRDWHVWAGRNILDQYHDWVVLVDRDGKLVDDYRY